jgi:hypothetical protein
MQSSEQNARLGSFVGVLNKPRVKSKDNQSEECDLNNRLLFLIIFIIIKDFFTVLHLHVYFLNVKSVFLFCLCVFRFVFVYLYCFCVVLCYCVCFIIGTCAVELAR